MTDSERLNWLEANQMSCISDDFGNWAVTQDGIQNMPRETPSDIQSTFFIEAAEWKPTIRDAIDMAIQTDDDEENTP